MKIRTPKALSTVYTVSKTVSVSLVYLNHMSASNVGKAVRRGYWISVKNKLKILSYAHDS